MFDRVYGLENSDEDYEMELALSSLTLEELYQFASELALMKKSKENGANLVLPEQKYLM